MNDFIEHLANLKFYADYKKSEAKTFDQYVDYIDSGTPEDFFKDKPEEKTVERFSFTDPLEDAEFENQVEGFLAKKGSEEQMPQLNLEDWYQNALLKIRGILEKENAYTLLNKEPIDELLRILEKHDLLEKYIDIGRDDFFHYTTWMQQRQPKDFFNIFSEDEKKIENYPLIKCFPRIFVDCKAYAFFTELQKENLNQADQNFLYVRLTNDGLLHCPAKEFEAFLNDQLLIPVQIYGHIKGENPRFRPTYDHYYSLWY